MVNGIFDSDAERDELIVRIEERQKEIIDDIREIKHKLDVLFECYDKRLQKLENDLTQTKVWVGIFSAIFIPLVVYLLQKAIQ